MTPINADQDAIAIYEVSGIQGTYFELLDQGLIKPRDEREFETSGIYIVPQSVVDSIRTLKPMAC